MRLLLALLTVGLLLAVHPFQAGAVEPGQTLGNQDQGPPSRQQNITDKEHLRKVEGQILSSTELPKLSLKFDNQFKYVGGHSFILYGVARAEQHFFVDADAKGQVKRLYWIQFEGYLPDNMFAYQYKATKTVKLGDLEFIADAMVRNIKTSTGKADSDGNRARIFLEDKGYRMASDDVLAQRLVHLVDAQKRNELLIIYMEDLAPMKLTAKDLAPDGPAASQWDGITKDLLERAVKGVEIVR